MDEFRAEATLEHKSKILDSYSKMKDAELLLDFNIEVKSSIFPVHRSFLAAGSDYFQAMFLHDKKVVEQGVVEIKEVDAEPMSRCIEFLYTGDTDINNENCQDILHVSSILQIDALRKLCFRFLQTNLSPENCLVVAHFAEIHNDPHVRNKAKKLAVDKFEVIVTTDLFPSISRSDLIYYLVESSVSSQVSWSAVTTWIKTNRDEEDLVKVLDDALKVMKLPIPFLLSTVLDDDIFDNRTMINIVSKHVFINTENLKESITASNCIKLKKLATQFLGIDEKALELINQFILDNIEEVSKCASYEAFSEDTPEELEAKMNNCISDKVKYELLSTWAHFKLERRAHFSRLFKLIKLKELSIRFIQQKIEKEKLVQQSPSCIALLDTCIYDANETFDSDYRIYCTNGIDKLIDDDDDELKFVSEKDLKIYVKSRLLCSERRWEAMKRWMENKDNANALFKDLLTVIRKTSSFEFLVNIVANDPFFENECELKVIAVSQIFSSISEVGDLCDKIDLNNCFILKSLNAQYNKVNNEIWNSEIEKLLTIHAPLVLRRKEILDFSKDEIENLIRVAECSADDKAKAILKWVKHKSERLDLLPGLSKHINLQLLSSPTVRSLQSDPAVSQLENSREILQKLASEGSITRTNSMLEDTKQDLFVVESLSGIGYICDLSSASTFVLSQTEKNSPIIIINIGENVYGINVRGIIKLTKQGNWDYLLHIPESVRLVNFNNCFHSVTRAVAFHDCLTFISRSELLMYNPVTDSWSDTLQGCDLETRFCVAASNESIYALDGMNRVGKRFNGVEKNWSDIAKMPQQDMADCAVFHNMVFMVGGADDWLDYFGEPRGIVQCYNPKSDCWTRISNLCHPRVFLSPCVVNNKLYVTGAKKDGSLSIELYDEENNQWKVIRELGTTKKYFSACAIPRGYQSFYSRQCFASEENLGFRRRIDTEFDRKIKQKYSVRHIISPDGGEMNLLGCRLIFPPSALDEETEVTLTVDSDPENSPGFIELETSDRLLSLDFPITPVMICKPSMKFNKPVTVEMNTCFSAREDKTIPVDIQIRKRESDWRKISTAMLGNTNKIRFTVSHFCGMAVTVSPELVDDGTFHLINDVYIQKRTAQIASVFSKDERTQRFMKEILQEENFVKFMGPSHEIHEGLGTQVNLRFECTEPEQTRISEGCPSSQFDINRQIFKTSKHVVCFKPLPRPREYTGVIDSDYYVKINEEAETRLMAAVEWPIQTRGTGPINISNVLHTGPRANVMATDNARVETHSHGGTNVVT
ncbi:uncharacterized protein LOC144421099 [Styela clava]